MTNLPFQLTVCGLGELTGYSQARVSHVLSILDPGTPVPTDFGAYAEHDRLELRFHDIIDAQPGLLCPDPTHIAGLLRFIQPMVDEPRADLHLLVHCHGGYSRSTAAAILVLAKARPELSGAELIEELLRIRSRIWPNLRMLEIGDELLGRDGDIVRAMHRFYGVLLEKEPELRQRMLEGGRAREVHAAVAPG
jgi:predicted protein tyrosine phosphatase